MIRYNLTIDSEIAGKFAEWQANRLGVIAWGNQEIGGGHPLEVFAPRLAADQTDIATVGENELRKYSPGWRYANPAIVDFGSLKVETFSEVSQYRGKLKRYYWGIGLTKASESKADKLAAKIENGTYRWEVAPDDGQLNAIVRLGTIQVLTWLQWVERQSAVIV